MKKDLLKKLKNYSKLTAAMVSVGGAANAQIIYTDVHPDTTLNTFPSNYEIDFDGDGNIDVNIICSGSSSSFAIKASPVIGASANYFLAQSSYIAQLNNNYLISSYATFQYGIKSSLINGVNLSGTTMLYGNWTSTDIVDKYVGIKFNIAGAKHYGWIRLTTHFVDYNNFFVTVKDFAYQSIPDSGIYAGAFDSLQINLGNDTVICYGDSLQLTADSGYYSYTWSTSQTGTNSIYVSSTGYYSVTVQDGPEGPVGTDSIYVEVSAPVVTQLLNYADPKCFGGNDGFIELSTSGGTPPFSYTWQLLYPDTNRIENLSAGDYFVTISDANNCSIDTLFTLTQPAEITVNFTSAIFCGGCNGEITATATGGNPPYQYLWSSGSGQTVTGLCQGTYTVTVIDDSLCVITASHQITESALANISGSLNYSGGTINAGEARVELYKDTIAGAIQLELIDSVYTQSGGYFEFTNVIPESFYLRAVITSSNINYSNIYTSYYSNIDTTTLWTFATLLTVACEDTIQNINFNMYENTTPLTGPGTFSGKIVYGNGTKAAGEPVLGAEVFAEQEPDEEPIANTETDTLGNWIIDNIPVGTGYRLSVDLPGIPLITTYQSLEISNGNTDIPDLNFYVDTLSGGGIFINTTGIITVKSDVIEINTYPNPVRDYINIEIALKNKEYISYSIIDINGKELFVSGKEYEQGKHIEKIKLNHFENGVFFLKLKIGNTVYIKKIIKT